MDLSFRWYGPDDPVSLQRIRQILCVDGIVSALHDVPAGEVWPLESVKRLRDEIEANGFEFTVVESIPVHESIKLGHSERDQHIDAFGQSLEHVAAAGVGVVCYNFMPVADWTRTNLQAPLPDGSTTLAYEHGALGSRDDVEALASLPGWAAGYEPDELRQLMDDYENVSQQQLWDNLAYFLERVVPIAEDAGVRLAIHPDDPPWSVFGLPRIVTSGEALERVTQLVDSPANGITLCTGSLGADPSLDLPAIAQQLAERIHFLHARNVCVTGPREFYETSHPEGDVDLAGVMEVLRDAGFEGPARPDHGRMIWEENGRPGYGLYDRALGATYLQGLWDAG